MFVYSWLPTGLIREVDMHSDAFVCCLFSIVCQGSELLVVVWLWPFCHHLAHCGLANGHSHGHGCMPDHDDHENVCTFPPYENRLCLWIVKHICSQAPSPFLLPLS